MTRGLAARLGKLLIGHAVSERYPTRSVEYMLAWALISWAFMLSLPWVSLDGSLYSYLTLLAPEWVWCTVGIGTGFMRLFALMRNGSWKKSPYLRLIGASLGFNFWLLLFVLYGMAMFTGAAAFPMYGFLPVFMFFEAYSSYRCGQDARGV